MTEQQTEIKRVLPTQPHGCPECEAPCWCSGDIFHFHSDDRTFKTVCIHDCHTEECDGPVTQEA